MMTPAAEAISRPRPDTTPVVSVWSNPNGLPATRAPSWAFAPQKAASALVQRTPPVQQSVRSAEIVRLTYCEYLLPHSEATTVPPHRWPYQGLQQMSQSSLLHRHCCHLRLIDHLQSSPMCTAMPAQP